MGRLKEFSVEQALEKAVYVFWTKGYEAASMSDLTAEMGIQKASLYDTFGNKAELFRQALAEYQDRGFIEVQKLLDASRDPVDAIRQILLTAVPQVQETPTPCSRKGCFCMNAAVELAPHHPEIAALIEAHYDRVRRRIAQTIALGQGQGMMRIDLTPLEAAAFVLDHLNGLHVAAKTVNDPDLLRRRVEFTLATLIVTV